MRKKQSKSRLSQQNLKCHHRHFKRYCFFLRRFIFSLSRCLYPRLPHHSIHPSQDMKHLVLVQTGSFGIQDDATFLYILFEFGMYPGSCCAFTFTTRPRAMSLKHLVCILIITKLNIMLFNVKSLLSYPKEYRIQNCYCFYKWPQVLGMNKTDANAVGKIKMNRILCRTLIVIGLN